MDKFTKTTEVDISNMGLIEEDTPQKSKAGKIIAIIISLLLSISIWLYVVETDKTEVEEVYENIVVHVLNEPDGYKVKAENVTVILTGTNSKLVDIDEADIIVNSALLYELGVLKTFAEPLLFSVPEDCEEYPEALRLINFLRNFLPIPSEDISKDSVLREFIGGSCFK